MSRTLLILYTITAFLLVSACTSLSDRSGELEGSWTIMTLKNDEVEGNKKPYLEFLEDGKISGSTGCNRLSGKVIQSEGTIKFTNMISTKRACLGNNVMQQERRILEALNTVVKFNHSSNAVELIDTDGNVKMTLSKKA